MGRHPIDLQFLNKSIIRKIKECLEWRISWDNSKSPGDKRLRHTLFQICNLPNRVCRDGLIGVFIRHSLPIIRVLSDDLVVLRRCYL